jgi:acetyl-CoA carboxylase carboxyl transferase subunit beta
MAWFRQEKKPRLPRHEKHEIPADAWEKCDQCGHTDLREKFVRNLNVCPNCGHHRRIRASEYAAILLDEGTADETEIDIRSTDPLGFPDYQARLKSERQCRQGRRDSDLYRPARRNAGVLNPAVMDFAVMGGSMGSVVGRSARSASSPPERKYPLIIISARALPACRRSTVADANGKAAAILSQLGGTVRLDSHQPTTGCERQLRCWVMQFSPSQSRD